MSVNIPFCTGNSSLETSGHVDVTYRYCPISRNILAANIVSFEKLIISFHFLFKLKLVPILHLRLMVGHKLARFENQEPFLFHKISQVTN